MNVKAEKEFLSWLKQEYNYLEYKADLFNNTYINALIIEWFDSIGIFINPYPCSDGLWDYAITKDGKCIADGIGYISRKDATKKAIEKATEIYNQFKY